MAAFSPSRVSIRSRGAAGGCRHPVGAAPRYGSAARLPRISARRMVSPSSNRTCRADESEAATECPYRAPQPNRSAPMAGPLHLWNHRGGAADHGPADRGLATPSAPTWASAASQPTGNRRWRRRAYPRIPFKRGGRHFTRPFASRHLRPKPQSGQCGIAKSSGIWSGSGRHSPFEQARERTSWPAWHIPPSHLTHRLTRISLNEIECAGGILHVPCLRGDRPECRRIH